MWDYISAALSVAAFGTSFWAYIAARRAEEAVACLEEFVDIGTVRRATASGPVAFGDVVFRVEGD